jgi:hypothetical protein
MTRTVIVSGGGTGIGRSVAARFARAGDHVIIIGRRAAVLEAVAHSLEGPGTVEWRSADLGDAADVVRVAAQLPDVVDVVVNNAGGYASRGMPWEGPADIARALTTDFTNNVLSAVLLTTALAPRLRRPGGRIHFHQSRDFLERGFVVCAGVDGTDVHVCLRGRSGHFNSFCIDSIIFLMGANKLHEDNLQLIGNRYNQPIVIAFDVEDETSAL